jgi:peptide deformylase
MPTQPIVLAGNLQLRGENSPIDEQLFNSLKAQNMVDTLLATMKANNGAGLAAPQVGLSYQLLVYGFDHNPRYPDQASVPLTVMFNPKIIRHSENVIEIYEGCLSLPDLRGSVPRYESIEIQAQNIKGESFTKTYHGFEARIIQHEIDHLNGTLFPERVKNLKTLGMTTALRKAGIIP